MEEKNKYIKLRRKTKKRSVQGLQPVTKQTARIKILGSKKKLPDLLNIYIFFSLLKSNPTVKSTELIPLALPEGGKKKNPTLQRGI